MYRPAAYRLPEPTNRSGYFSNERRQAMESVAARMPLPFDQANLESELTVI
jgi:hypothetical protein